MTWPSAVWRHSPQRELSNSTTSGADTCWFATSDGVAVDDENENENGTSADADDDDEEEEEKGSPLLPP